jgi:heme A synthase
LHLINAFALLAALLWLAKLALDDNRAYRAPVLWLLGILVLQILLGVEAWMPWMRRLLDPTAGIRESMGILWIRSLHYLLGTLLFANIVVIALKAHRGLTVALPKTVPALPARQLEGTA